jgi:membrane protease subunit HflK
MAARPDDNDRRPPSDLPFEVEEPRRGASARFVVEDVDSATAQMREAMDPANQSLAEALRLSYRVLQLGILALVVTFLFSGFQSVKEGYTGVMTVFGKIVETDEGAQLAPGLHPFWPYPVGEFVVFEARRTVVLDRDFQPRERPNQTTREQQIEAADASRDLVPERDGFVLTSDGDIAHLSLTAQYVVDDAVEFVGSIGPQRSERLVRDALRRGAVLAASQFTLKDLIEQRDAPALEIRLRAQEALDRLRTGITIAEVTVTDRSPPRFVESRFREVQAKREEAKADVERARQEVAAILTNIAGEKAFGEIVRLMQDYETALAESDAVKAETLLAQIGTRFDQPDIGGEVASIVQEAKASRAALVAQLKQELSRIEGLAPAFRDNPRQLVRQLWLDGLREVYAGDEVEMVSAPSDLSLVTLTMESSPQVMQTRRDNDLRDRARENEMRNQQYAGWMLRGDQISIGSSFGRLERGAQGGRGRSDVQEPGK